MSRRAWRLVFVVAVGGALFLAGVATGTKSAAAELSVEWRGDNVAVLADGKLFTEYLIDNCPKPILWPVIGPTGAEMSRNYPMKEVEGERQDHVHHRSLWFTHGNVNGIDFWSEVPNHGTIKHREYVKVAAEGDEAVIVTRNDWLAPDGKRQCEDLRHWTFRVGDGWRTIDLDVTVTASDGPVTFGDTKEGSFGIRIPTVMDVKSEMGGHIVTSKGVRDVDAWGTSANWVDYYGVVDGQPVGIAIMNHPDSFRAPTYWHVRDYGLFAANPFGLHDFKKSNDVDGSYTIPDGESITLRYRILLHKGDEKEGRVAEAFGVYADEKQSE